MTGRVRKKHRHHRRKKHLALKITLSIIAVLLIVLGAVSFAVYKNVQTTFASSYVKTTGTTPVNFSKSQPFTTLLLETGTVDNKKTCFAAVVASTNAQTKKTTFLNFPVTALLPDQTTIEGTYSSGGETAVLKNIKNQLQLPINKTIQIDTDKMGELIEATGGISLQNPKAFVANSYQFNQGSIQLSNSAQVKAYLSLVDENDQAALVTRIQNVSMALYGNIQKLAHAKQISSINTYRNILYAFSDTVKTDISFNDFKTIALNYNKSLTTTSKLNLHTTDVSGSKVVSAQELTNIKKLFNQSLK